MILWLNPLQHARDKNVVFVGILERVVDEFKIASWQLQSEGAKTARELPGIVDQVITYQYLDFGDDKPPMRGFVCTAPNPWSHSRPRIAAGASIRSSRPISGKFWPS